MEISTSEYNLEGEEGRIQKPTPRLFTQAHHGPRTARCTTTSNAALHCTVHCTVHCSTPCRGGHAVQHCGIWAVKTVPAFDLLPVHRPRAGESSTRHNVSLAQTASLLFVILRSSPASPGKTLSIPPLLLGSTKCMDFFSELIQF